MIKYLKDRLLKAVLTETIEINATEDFMSQPLDTFYTTEYGDFAIMKTRFGLYTSYDRECKQLVTGATWDSVFQITPSHLKWSVVGYTAPEGTEQVEYDGVVGGKL